VRFDASSGGRRDGAVNILHPDASVPGDDATVSPGADATTPPPDGGTVTPTTSGALEVVVGEPGRTVIEAAALLPMGGAPALTPGEVYIEGGRVRCVGAVGSCAAMSNGATRIRTPGIAMPGLVDSHNHIAYDWLPEWRSGMIWNDNGQWRNNAGYEAWVQPYNDNKDDRASLCAMVGWGELRALAHGTTTVFGNPTARTCFRGLARNAELSTGYNGFTRDRIRSNALGIDVVDAMTAMTLIDGYASGDVAAYLIHIAEGKTQRSRDELAELESFGLLLPQTVIIHGTALTPDDWVRVGVAGTKLVWSPSSNMALYQGTTDVASAHQEGVPIAIAPDWTVSGSGDMMHELGFARGWLDTNEPGLWSDHDLVEMGTSVPANHMGLTAEVGRLADGLLADVVLLDVAPGSDPYATVVRAARGPEVQLVLVGGVPTYGDASLIARLPDAPATCFAVDACGRMKRVCGPMPPDGTIDPDALRSAITAFYAMGPIAVVGCAR